MILCAGEALIDMLPRQTVADGDVYAPCAGGAVFNTAIALGRLGIETQFCSGISTDFFGDLLRARLAEARVDDAACILSERPTTLAFVKLVDGHASYAFYDENTAGRMLSPSDMPTPAPDVSAVFCGGISLAVEPCAAAYESLFTQSAAACVTMIDPNIRPSFIAEPARFRARIEHMLAHADIVKVSDEDLDWLLGDMETEAQIAALLDLGPKLICYTEGSKGVRGITRALNVHVPAQKVDVVDTVGAGDTFNAGFMAGLEQAGVLTKAGIDTVDAETLKGALRLGARAAAVTVSRAGANPPWEHEL